MIVSIGSDIVDRDFNRKIFKDISGPSFARRVLSDVELQLFRENPDERFVAGRFAAKESILKCLGTGMQEGISLQDITIGRSDFGQPLVLLDGHVLSLANQLDINSWHVTISHTPSYTMASVIAESRNF